MNRWLALGILLATGVALGLRCPKLGIRPMHNDEAVNGIKFGQLREHGTYKYDAREFHGPTLPYATLLLDKFSGRVSFDQFSESRLRVVSVIFGVGLILLLPLVWDGLGRNGTIAAALLTAVSPAMVFYSRYYIHEMLLVFFTFAALAGGWRYWRTRKPGWAILAGAGLGLMHATKETFVLNVAAIGLALGCNHLWNRKFDASKPPIKAAPLNLRHASVAAGAWLIVAILLFSSFFTNAQGIADSVRTYLPWLGRAGGASPHIYPWHFYAHRLLFFHLPGGPFWSEGLIAVLSIIGAGAGFARRGLADGNASFVRFLALYTFILASIYSLIGYKTPWCLLEFWHGAILLAGVGASVLLNISKYQWARLTMRLVITLCAAQLAAQAWQASASEKFSADPRNPYVFAQTSPDILRMLERIDAVAAAQPEGKSITIKVIGAGGDFWPLPWYLRNFDHVLLGTEIPADPYATIMIVSKQFNAHLDDNHTHLMNGYFQMRPGVFFELYVELKAWERYLQKNPRPPEKD